MKRKRPECKCVYKVIDRDNKDIFLVDFEILERKISKKGHFPGFSHTYKIYLWHHDNYLQLLDENYLVADNERTTLELATRLALEFFGDARV